MKRKDGRQTNQIRPLTVERGILKRADGSCRLSQGGTTILCAVFGPLESKSRNELLDRAHIEVIFKPSNAVPGMEEKEIEYHVRNSVENIIISSLHPRTSITIVLQVLADEGSLLAVSINAANIALVDAGVSVRSNLAAITTSLILPHSPSSSSSSSSSSSASSSSTPVLVLDPDLEEQKMALSTFTFVFNNHQKGIVSSVTSGVFSENNYYVCLDFSRTAADKIFAFYRIHFCHAEIK
eukprot:TRINITY_DN2094_c0_g2_i1.p1 TRINITY_DN2094_c0_g2~~TRINITY_DN2094_c0_g2_i1.p1  ORF type:complete len:251 (+),score=78.13 TRINITY_DN2094_c0_g2_i1:38-754(+)